MDPDRPAFKIATLTDIREENEGEPIELWFNRRGRVVVRAWNECGNNYTEVDLLRLVDWAKENDPGNVTPT
jgi:hypothetical protein